MEQHAELFAKLIKKTYVHQGLQNGNSRQSLIRTLLTHKKLPRCGWDDCIIEYLVNEFSLMDTNNFEGNVGVGEREGRIYSSIVSRRHFHLAHGIGRSGDILEVQPKAAGSSLIYILATSLVKHALHIAGFTSANHCMILPLATGMSITLCMLALKQKSPDAKYVVWSRIDQKSCFKSIIAAGLIPLVVELVYADGMLSTNVDAMRLLLQQYGSDVLCILSTTSCFAPRQPDTIDEIAVLCKEFGVGHVVNNAYGLQCPYICKLLNRASTIGRVDGVVQSTDKNFMVPVGGAIIASPTVGLIESVSANYPGRASSAPILDLFITLLSMGEQGYRDLLQNRLRLLTMVETEMASTLPGFVLTRLPSPRNSVSIAYSLDAIVDAIDDSRLDHTATAAAAAITYLGSMLFQRGVSGLRVIPHTSKVTNINGYSFGQWGAHSNNYEHSYFTIACSIGVEKEELIRFIDIFQKTLKKFAKQKTVNRGDSSMLVSDVDISQRADNCVTETQRPPDELSAVIQSI